MTEVKQPSGTLSESLLDKLATLRRALRLRLFGEAVAWLFVVLSAGAAGTFAFDYALRLDRPLRIALLAIWGAVLAWTLWRKLLAPLTAPLRRDDLALLVEGRFGALQGRLIGALQFATTPAAAGTSEAMIARMTEEAGRLAGDLPVGRIVEHRRLWRIALLAVVCVLVVAGAAFARPDLATLWAQRNVFLQDVDWPQETYLSVFAVERDGSLRPLLDVTPDGRVLHCDERVDVLRGGELTIVVEVAPGTTAPDEVTVHTRYPSVGETIDKQSACSPAESARWRQLRKSPPETTYFVKRVASVTEPIVFHVTGGDDRRDGRRPHRVHLIDPPSLRKIRFPVDYPAYIRSNRLTVLDGGRGVLSVPIGTTVHLQAETNKDLASAVLMLDGKPGPALRVIDDEQGRPRQVAGSWSIGGANEQRRVSLTIGLKDTNGYENPRAGQFVVHVEPDRAPETTLRSIGVRDIIAPTARIPLRADASDDHGVAEIVLSYRTAAPAKEGAEPVWTDVKPIGTPIKSDGTAERTLRADRELDIDPLKLPVGTMVVVESTVRDHLPEGLKGPNTVQGEPLKFRVVTGETILAYAVSKQREVRVEFFEAMAQQVRARGRVDALAAEAKDGKDVRPELKTAEAMQASVREEVRGAATSLEAVATELELNRVGKSEDVADLRTRVVEPLVRLGRSIDEITAMLRDAREAPSASVPATLAKVLTLQGDALTQMSAILKAMRKMENRVELARRLEGLLKMAVELEVLLDKRAKQGTESMFDQDKEPK